MNTTQEILSYLKSRKEYYIREIDYYNEIINDLNFNSNDYHLYSLLKQMDKDYIFLIDQILEFIKELETK